MRIHIALLTRHNEQTQWLVLHFVQRYSRWGPLRAEAHWANRSFTRDQPPALWLLRAIGCFESSLVIGSPAVRGAGSRGLGSIPSPVLWPGGGAAGSTSWGGTWGALGALGREAGPGAAAPGSAGWRPAGPGRGGVGSSEPSWRSRSGRAAVRRRTFTTSLIFYELNTCRTKIAPKI